MSISVTGLTKIYGQQKAVNNISFSVGKGEIVGFLGPNGAGKSSTMKIITGYLQPDAGQVEVCGTDVVKDPMITKKKIGYLPESNPLYYDIIDAFHRLTGCPVIVNTSFNVRGEPMVCTPEDAYRCFMRTDMDLLVLENFLLEKAVQPKSERDESWKTEFALD